MMKLIRGWGFPIGLLIAWSVAFAYATYALGSMESAVRSADLAAIAALQSQDAAHPA